MQAVLTEKIKPIPSVLIDGVAIWGFIFVSLYVLIYVFPQWETLVAQPFTQAVSKKGWSVIIQAHLALLVINLTHNYIYWNVAIKAGSVINAICKACQSVLVVVLSQLLFCDASHPLQCLDGFKVMGGVLILGGTALYNLSPASQQSSTNGTSKQVSSGKTKTGFTSKATISADKKMKVPKRNSIAAGSNGRASTAKKLH